MLECQKPKNIQSQLNFLVLIKKDYETYNRSARILFSTNVFLGNPAILVYLKLSPAILVYFGLFCYLELSQGYLGQSGAIWVYLGPSCAVSNYFCLSMAISA